MSMDITNCEGIGCPIKEKCRRNDYFRKTGNSGVERYEHHSSFMKPPFKINKGKFTCDMFWGDGADYLFEQIKSIIEGSGLVKRKKHGRSKK